MIRWGKIGGNNTQKIKSMKPTYTTYEHNF